MASPAQPASTSTASGNRDVPVICGGPAGSSAFTGDTLHEGNP